MGVPELYVQNKMRSEGLDPDLLDTPDATAPSASDGGGGGPGRPSTTTYPVFLNITPKNTPAVRVPGPTSKHCKYITSMSY